MSPHERRMSLLGWLRERSTHEGLTATEIVDVIGPPYNAISHGRYDRCFDDLVWLKRAGEVQHAPGRPARWYVA